MDYKIQERGRPTGQHVPAAPAAAPAGEGAVGAQRAEASSRATYEWTRLGLEEGGEGAPAPEMHADVLEPLVQAANDVEDESAVGDDLAQSTELLHHLL